MRKEQFEEGEFYHIYNRGVDRRTTFGNDSDRIRFLHSLYVLNNFAGIPFRFNIFKLEPRELLTPQEPYVEIVAGCLMPNHFHLMLRPKKKDGISKFMHKVGSSYTLYFNRLNERSGCLFEGPFKAKHVDRHEYASYLTQYIHLNPIDLWRTKLSTKEDLWKKVAEYQWSSLPVYLGENNIFSLVVNEDFRNTTLGIDAATYHEFCQDSLEDLCRA